MSNERGDDERIRDAGVDSAWRAASADEPSREADAAILAAARAEARATASATTSTRRTPWWTRWQPLAAAAGVAGLAFLIVQRLPGDRPQPDADYESSPEASVEAPRGDEVQGPVAPAPAAPSAAELPRDAETANRAKTDVVPATKASTARPEAALVQGAGIAAMESAVQRRDPDAWVQRILDLHNAGELLEAEAELRGFRQAYPDADARLPASLREWAATVDTEDR